MSYALTVLFRLKPGMMDEFLPLMLTNSAASLANEPGCHRFDVLTDPSRPDDVYLYEIYADPAAFEAHTQTPHFHAFNAASEGMVADKTVDFWKNVAP